MRDYSLKPSITIVAGKSGSGKTTFCYRYLVNAQNVLCRFVFDPKGEAPERLGIAPAETAEELELALADGFVVYHPGHMFSGHPEVGFAYFCNWVLSVSERVRGRELFLVDEVWKYCNPHTIPDCLATCCQDGRSRGIEMIFATQRPNRLNESITNEATEIILFRLNGSRAIAWAEEFGYDPDEVLTIAPGAFVALNCDSGGESRGKVF